MAPPTGNPRPMPAGWPGFGVSALPRGGPPSAQGPVEVDRGADQREVGEGLGEVALLLAGAADLLGVEAHVVGVGEHLLEGQPRLVQASRTGEGLDVPEGADREGALLAA